MADFCGVTLCDLTKNYCVGGLCIDKTIAQWGIIGIIAIAIIIGRT